MIGLEPITCWLQISCSANWATSACCNRIKPQKSHFHYLNDSKGIWTPVTAVKGRCLNRLTMEPGRKLNLISDFMFPKTPPVGLEPTTLRLTAACSTDWAKEEYWIWTSVPSNKMYYTPIGRIMQYPFANITSCSLLHGLNIIFVFVWSISLCLCINRRLHSRLNFRQSP